MCAKQLYVKSNGQWVAASGAGGSVDTAGLATEQFVTDAIAAIPATDLTGYATLTDLNDALATIPESSITVHDGSIPNPAEETPKGLEDSFAGYTDGLHYFKEPGTLVAITRQQYQTDITLTGPTSSSAKIVKSEAGLPTPQNPSMIVLKTADGQWIKMTSDALDSPFGQPQMVNLFALTGGGADLTNYYTKPEVDAALAGFPNYQYLSEITDSLNASASFYVSNASTQLDAKIQLKADKADTYTKKEVDDKLEADKDFSIANDNVLLASITSLQEIVTNLGSEIGTGQVDVLDAIRDVEIEPSMLSLTGDATSPIAWKGGLSLVPVKEGGKWRLHWNDGKAIHTLFHADELTTELIVASLIGQNIQVNDLEAVNFKLGDLAIGAGGGRLVTQEEGGPENTVAYLSDIAGQDLSAYALLNGITQEIVADQMKAQAFTFTKSGTILGYVRTPEKPTGHLGIEIGGPGGKVEYVAYESSLANYATKKSVDLLGGAVDAVIGGTYTKEEANASFAKKDDASQNVIANAFVGQGFVFGSEAVGSNPGLVYTDTGEGYGPRLVLGTPSGNELIPYQSDFEPIKARLNTLESKGAPVTDLSGYAPKEDVTLLQGQVQDIFSSIYTRAESDARYAQKTDLAPYITTTQVNTVMGAFATRAYVDGKFTSVNPTGAVTVNDPGMADFKKSVLDAVALMLAGGGPQPPADIGWTPCRTAAGTADSVIQVRMIAGMMEFKGTLSTGSISGSQSICQLPASFPTPELTASYPIAARLAGSNAVYTYTNFTTNSRIIGVTMAGTINEVTLSGLRVRAAY